MTHRDESLAEGLLDELAHSQRDRSAVSSPQPAHPLDPTYSPSREGSTPMPGPRGSFDQQPPGSSLIVNRGTGPYGMNAVAALDPTRATNTNTHQPPAPAPLEPPAPAPVQNFPTGPRTGKTPPPQVAATQPRTGLTPPPVIRSFSNARVGSASSSGNTPAAGALPALHVGRVIGERWQVGQRIGIGGMAAVHEGLDHRLGRSVAIKILHPHVAENPDSRERLAREARAIAQLEHENVIRVYDYSSDDPECTWLVTELIDGPSLRQILDRIEKPMPEVAVMITTEVVRALRAAHAMGIAHRDVKPDNVLVGSAGRPKLSDFGIAQIVNEQRMTLTGNLVGSPSYMSPEQANGKRTDHRTDLFSAGILLYRLVTGTLPFRGATAIETIRKVSVGEYTDPVEIESGCAGAVAGIIRRALSTGIDERYQSADEMLRDLTIVLQDAGLSATWEELPKFFKDPGGYQTALRPRLARELEARGKALLDAGEETRAVDCFNRALSLGEGNQRTLDLVRELSKRRGKGRVRRFVWATAVAVGAVAMISGVLLATDRLITTNAAEPLTIALPAPPPEVPVKVEPKLEPKVEEQAVVQEPVSPPPQVKEKEERHSRSATRRRSGSSSSKATTTAPVEPPPARSTIIAAGLPPREEAPAEKKEPASSDPVDESGGGGDAAPTPSYGTLQVGVNVWADIWVDGRKLGTAPDRSRYPLMPGDHRVRAIKPNCASDEKEFTIAPGKTTRLRLTITCP